MVTKGHWTTMLKKLFMLVDHGPLLAIDIPSFLWPGPPKNRSRGPRVIGGTIQLLPKAKTAVG